MTQIQKSPRFTTAVCARLLGKSEQFVRIGLQRKTLPFGWAVKTSSQWDYFISPVLFQQYTGIVVPSEYMVGASEELVSRMCANMNEGGDGYAEA